MKKQLAYLIIISLILLSISFAGCKTIQNTLDKKETTTSSKNVHILYGRYSNDVTSNTITGAKCFNFTVNEYVGAGIVRPEDSDGTILALEGYYLGQISSKKYDSYYYVSSTSVPQRKIMGFTMIDFDFPEQSLLRAKYKDEISEKIKEHTADKFPTVLETSKENKYLAYTLTTKGTKTADANSTFLNPYLNDSELVIRDLKTGKEKSALSKKYNRQLFNSFLHFSDNENCLFTIAREDSGFKFVKVMLDSGIVTDMSKSFTDFDFSNANLNKYFPTTGTSGIFKMAPDESKILVYKNTPTSNIKNVCAPGSEYKLECFELEKDQIKTYAEGVGYIQDCEWKPDNKEYALIMLSCGGCYPDYIDAEIQKFNRDGKEKKVLVKEEKCKISNLGYSPSGDKIAFDVYGMDFIGCIKTVDPENKKVKDIINSRETEGSVNKKKPIVLSFRDWIVE